jgi:hypothetical protein
MGDHIRERVSGRYPVEENSGQNQNSPKTKRTASIGKYLFPLRKDQEKNYERDQNDVRTRVVMQGILNQRAQRPPKNRRGNGKKRHENRVSFGKHGGRLYDHLIQFRRA